MPQGRETIQLALMVEEVSVSDVFHLTVDYGKPFHDMASPKWHLLMDGTVTEENFPIISNGDSGIVELEMRYLAWPFTVCSKMATEGIKMVGRRRKMSLAEAEIQHMLVLGTCKPEGLHSNRQVVGLGSVAVIKGKYHVPCMAERASIWDLTSSPLDLEWAEYTDFLVFSKKLRGKVR